MTCRSWQSEDDLVIKEEQNEYSYELTGKRVLGKAAAVILTATALFWLPELAGVLLAGLVLLQRKIADTFLV